MLLRIQSDVFLLPQQDVQRGAGKSEHAGTLVRTEEQGSAAQGYFPEHRFDRQGPGSIEKVIENP